LAGKGRISTEERYLPNRMHTAAARVSSPFRKP